LLNLATLAVPALNDDAVAAFANHALVVVLVHVVVVVDDDDEIDDSQKCLLNIIFSKFSRHP
jgi:hypothetical protein